MGNQLVGAAPAQIFPVEHYMGDISDLDFDGRYEMSSVFFYE